MLYNTF